MKITEAKIPGVYTIQIERIEDERGYFARTFDSKTFEDIGLTTNYLQCSVSYNKEKGTLRGMHYQIPPYSETKIVTCTGGKIYDVVVDLRKNSPTYKKWASFEISSEKFNSVYIPNGVAHGFQTLSDDTTVYYQISQVHDPKSSRGFRWNDPSFGIDWPMQPSVISKKDLSYADFNEEQFQ